MIVKKHFVRHYVILFILGFLTVLVIIRYAYLAYSGEKAVFVSKNSIVSIRGAIYDREGRLLAVDTDLYDLSAWKPAISKGKESDFAEKASEILAMDKYEILDKLTGSGPDFVYIAKRISASEFKALEKLGLDLGFKGLRFDRVSGRVYPEKDLAAQLIGFTGTENIGLSGAEAAFDEILAANPKMAQNGYAYGNSVYLTIDADLQYRLEEISDKTLQANLAEALALIVIEAKTGAILAYISLPDYDPNFFLGAERSSWVDRVAMYAYEPGSVFKVYSMASILALGAIDSESSFICDGRYERHFPSGEDVIINCLGSHGRVNITKILEYSCNSGAAYASDTVSGIDFYTKIREFGFGERAGADLRGENPGLIRSPEQWSGRTKPTIAMGQELLVTALQMASAATALANGGELLRVRSLSRISDPSGLTIEEPQPIVIRKIMDKADADSILKDMEAVVLSTGTGHRARIDDMRMSVKTGTAQVIDPNTHRYSDSNYTASTIALFPSEDPQYIVYTAIFNPKGPSTYGGRIAAPFIKEVAELVADLYGVPRAASASINHSGMVRLAGLPEAKIGNVMPNLIGYPKKSLTALLEREDLVVEIAGEGWVVEQSPKPGESISHGQLIILKLE